jgi:L-2-hydroxyglutarate oxidase
LEKEFEVAKHQTGHNSGVIHAGIYYPPDSLKAKFCREGATATIAFCRQHNIPYNQCGKLLVATTPDEQQRMLALYQRAQEHKLEVSLLTAKQLQKQEPNIVGTGAILVPSTAIVDYRQIARTMAEQITALGGEIRLAHEVIKLKETTDQINITALNRQTRETIEIASRYLITCAGLLSDRTTKMLGIKTDFQIIPYRGEYYQLPKAKALLTKHLIYPIPDPTLPFLGVHLTKMIDGSMTVGPNAVQGWKREGYGGINISVKDTAALLCFPGFWKVTAKHLKSGIKEIKNSWSKKSYLTLVNKYCPSITRADLHPYPTGIRAQAVLKDGTLVHDFLFADSPRSIHVCNAPSPAATSAIPIGKYICDKMIDKAKISTTPHKIKSQ